MTSQYAIPSIHEIFRNRHCYHYRRAYSQEVWNGSRARQHRKRFGMGAGPDSIARGLEWEQGQTADTILKGMTIASNALRENACI
jgi:hypothetical protein